MALYLLSMKYVSRGQGRSSVAAAAYRSGEKMYYDGQTFDYSSRNDIVHSEIFLPENIPREFKNRQILWNEVEKAEDKSTRWKTARTAKEVVVALPREFTFETNIDLVRSFVVNNFVKIGMCADFSVHRGDNKDSSHVESDHMKILPHNPHAHILLTTRQVEPSGFSAKKNREWDKREFLISLRERWADIQNDLFMHKGLFVEVSHESYKDQGIDLKPKVHLGPVLSAIERKGIQTNLGNLNRDIDKKNQQKRDKKEQQLKQQEKDLKRGYER